MLRGALPAAEVAAARSAVLRHLPAERAPGRMYSVDHGQTADALADPGLAAVAAHPLVLRCAAQLLGAPPVLSAFVAYLKTAGAGPTAADHRGPLPGRPNAHQV